MAQQFWLVKQEPDSYSWTAFVADGGTAWTGVRSFPGRLHLRGMKKGDLVLYYHSSVGKEVVGCAKVAREAYPDPTAEEGDWSCVDLVPFQPLKRAVTLEQLKVDPLTKDLPLIRQSRLSVMPIPEPSFRRILELAGTTLKSRA
ncbi:MAG TPA: EVE domain-containing protein [Verrucomicrobiota bacterium]|nr:EVE domain-containing protein [Verrucomicrobiales bacterium]HRI15594.1 EVE domain-containing protein [Verrucomicrobiota bacterium]